MQNGPHFVWWLEIMQSQCKKLKCELLLGVDYRQHTGRDEGKIQGRRLYKMRISVESGGYRQMETAPEMANWGV